MKNMLDSIFFTRLFVSERKQIALMADEKSPTRISRRLFATSRSEMGINMVFDIIDSMESLESIKDEWNDLLKRINYPEIFYDYEWIRTYLDFYEPDRKNYLCICTAYQGNKEKLVGVYPFALKDGIIEFVISKSADYASYYVDKAENKYRITEKAVDYILHNRSVKGFKLDNFPSRSELFILESILKCKGFMVTIDERVVTVKCSSTQATTKFQTRELKSITRNKNKILREHELHIETSSKLSSEIYDFISFRKDKKFGLRQYTAPNVKDFYLNLFHRVGNNAYVNVMYIDGNIAAAHMGFISDSKIYYYVPAYDEGYANYGSGMVLAKHLIDENKGKEFDFLRGNETYKFYWADLLEMNFCLRAYERNLSGKGLVLLQGLMNGVKGLR